MAARAAVLEPRSEASSAAAEAVGSPQREGDQAQTDGDRTMRAAVIQAPGQLAVISEPVADPGPGQLLIRLEGCGVCTSNIPTWQGRDWFSYPQEPGAPGHEGWGHVAAVGEGVRGIREGDRVAALSYHAFADHDVAAADAAVVLPTSLDGVPVPGEPLGCAVNIARRASIEEGQTVAIVGIGFLGALLTRLASDAGARVIAVSRRESALELARSSGAHHTVRMDDHWRVRDEVRELTGGGWCERVIEATGAQWPLDLAGELTAERGRLVIAGYHQDGQRQVNMQLWNWRGLDVINAHERDPRVYVDGMREAVELMAAGRLDPTPLFSHRFPLDRAADALDAAVQRPDGFVKALVLT